MMVDYNNHSYGFDKEADENLKNMLPSEEEQKIMDAGLEKDEQDFLLNNLKAKQQADKIRENKQKGMDEYLKIDDEVDAADNVLSPEQKQQLKTIKRANIINKRGLTPQDIQQINAHKASLQQSAAAGVPEMLARPDQPPLQQGVGVLAPQNQQSVIEQSASRPVRTATPGAYDKITEQYNEGLEEDQAALKAESDKRTAAIDQSTAAVDDATAATDEFYDNAANVQQEYAQKQAEWFREREEVTNEMMIELDKKQSELDDFKIEPFKDKSTASKIGLIIGAALMSVGASLQGKDGSIGIRTIQKFMDQDIAVQKAEYAKKRADFKDTKNLYGMMLEQFDDRKAAELATKDTQLLQVQNMLDKKMAAAKNEQQKAKFADMKAQIEQQRLETKTQLRGRIHDRTLEAQKAKDNVAMERRSLRLSERALGQKQNAAEKPRPILPASEASKLGGIQKSIESLADLESSFQDKTDPVFGRITKHFPGTNAEWESKAALFSEQLLRDLSGAQVSEQEAERIRNLVPTAGETWRSAQPKLQALAKELKRIHQKKLESFHDAGYDVSGYVNRQQNTLDIR